MIKQVSRFVVLGALSAGVFVGGASMSSAQAETSPEKFTKQGFLDASLRNCAGVQGRPPESCKCEQMLIDSDRLSADDKEMAFYYWTDKKEFGKRFEAKKAADAEWQKGFSERFTNLQALIISACGR